MAPPRKRITLSTEGVEGTNSRRISSWNNISSDEDEISVVEVVPVPQRSRRALSPWGKDKKLEWEVVIPWKIDLDRSIFREIPGENHVRKVIEEMEEPITHELRYKTRFADGHIETVSSSSGDELALFPSPTYISILISRDFSYSLSSTLSNCPTLSPLSSTFNRSCFF